MGEKIGIVVPNFESTGGVQTVANFLKENIKKSTWELEIISLATSYEDELSKKIIRPFSWFKRNQTKVYYQDEIKVTRVGCNWSELEFQRYKPRENLTNLLDSFDVIQIVAGYPAWAKVAEFTETPIALQIATLVEEEREEMLKKSSALLGHWRSLMTKVTSKYDYSGLEIADAIFIENEWMLERLKSEGFKDKTYFAPPGIDTNIFKPPEEGIKNEDTSYILTVGRLNEERKDVKTLFKTYSIISKKLVIPPKLVLAGTKLPNEEQLKLAKELGIYQNIVFEKKISLSQLVRLYQHADIFLLTSREEGLGMVLMEAMACETAVVSTDCGGPSTLIDHGENGYLIEVGNHTEIAKACLELLTKHDLRRKFSEKGLKKVRSYFSADETYQKFENVYEELL